MSRNIICVAGFTALTAFAGIANAQSIAPVQGQGSLSGCNAVTGLGPNGRPCVSLTPIDPSRIADAPTNIEGANRFGRLDVTTLGQTFECREATSTNDLGTGDGTLLFEDCGAPLSPLEYGNLKPFYGTTGQPVAPVSPTPVPASATTFIPPQPTLVQPALPTVTTPPVGSALPPIGEIAGASLAGAPTGFVPLLGLAAPFLATAAAGGAIAAAAAAGGGSSTPSTN